MKLPFTGGCLCGQFRYTCSIAPDIMYYCHCTDCRKINGTAYHTGLYLERGGVTFSGGLKSFAAQADSGRTIIRYYCDQCGSQIYSDKGETEKMISLKAGTLDEPDSFMPDTQIWTQSKVHWADFPANLNSFEKGPFD